MPIERPARLPAGAVTNRVRRAILLAANRHGITSSSLLALHAQAEQLGSHVDLLADVEERYNRSGSLVRQVDACRRAAAQQSGPVSPMRQREVDAECVLYALPDAEFLTVIEHAVDIGYREERFATGMLAELLTTVDGALQAHGCPYRRNPDDWRQFEWVGDPKQHELVIEPALLALSDARFAGAAAEFEDARRKRRHGAPKDLEDAVDEAAKSVESVLKVLHDERGVSRPSTEVVSQLFKSLRDAQVLPPYVSNLVTAAASPRNNMASHGQGGTVREVPEELADASIAAAATAIAFLAHYLP